MSGGATDTLLTVLAQVVGPAVECRRIEFQPGPGRSAATLGLQKLSTTQGAAIPFALHVEEQVAERKSEPSQWRWAAVTALLLLLCLGVRYAEAFVFKSSLSNRLAQLNSRRKAFPAIDRELAFLQYLETNQPPFLDALYVIAKAAPAGTRFDSVTTTRRGDLALRGNMPNSQQAMDFRSKLIDSAFFSGVTLDEQTPSQDRQKVNFRLTAQWRPNGERPRLTPEKDPKLPKPTGPTMGEPPPGAMSMGNSPGMPPSAGAISIRPAMTPSVEIGPGGAPGPIVMPEGGAIPPEILERMRQRRQGMPPPQITSPPQ